MRHAMSYHLSKILCRPTASLEVTARNALDNNGHFKYIFRRPFPDFALSCLMILPNGYAAFMGMFDPRKHWIKIIVADCLSNVASRVRERSMHTEHMRIVTRSCKSMHRISSHTVHGTCEWLRSKYGSNHQILSQIVIHCAK